MKIDFMTKCDIEYNIKRINDLINTNIFSFENISLYNSFGKSAFIEILICMRDLMAKTKWFASRISFKDDVVIVPGEIKDVTDLIRFVRNALCHPESEDHYLDLNKKIKATYNVSFGKGIIMEINDIKITSDYEDDVCFAFGTNKIYLKRHIIRALEEVKQKLIPLF